MGLKRGGSHRDRLDLLWPDSIRVRPGEVAVGARWARSFEVVGYPRTVTPGWFEPLLRFPRPLTVHMYSAPVSNDEALGRMRRRILWSRGIEEAGRTRGRLTDPAREAAVDDAEQMRRDIVRGETRMVETAITLTLWAGRIEDLDVASQLLETLCRGMLMVIRLLRYRQIDGLARTIPLGSAPAYVREMDSRAWATLFPFASDDVIHAHGQVMGINPGTRSLVIVDRFELPSPHSVTVGWSGAGKSFAAKLEAIRSRYRRVAVTIVDPEGEYTDLEALGARVWRIGDPEAGGFPYDPFRIGQGATAAEIERQTDFLMRFLYRVDRDFMESWRPVVGEAVWSLIGARRGDTVFRPQNSPLCTAESLVAEIGRIRPTARPLAESAIFRWRRVAGTPPGGDPGSVDFQVFDLSRLTAPFKAAAYLALAELTIRRMGQDVPRLVIFDEAWNLLAEADTAVYLEELFRRARKWDTALSLITQDIGDFVRSQAAEVCLRNAPIVLLMRQHPESLAQMQELMRLHEGEVELLARAGPGEGLLLVGDDHIPLKVVAAPGEMAWEKRLNREGREG